MKPLLLLLLSACTATAYPSCGEALLPPICAWPERLPGAPQPNRPLSGDGWPRLEPFYNTSELYMLTYPESAKPEEALYASCFMRTERKALFTAHVLTEATVQGECTQSPDPPCSRPSFRLDERLCKDEQDKTDYYTHSGFQRGHLTPNAAFGERLARGVTFRVTNVVPQTGDRNLRTWAALEASLRKLVTPDRKFSSIFVYTAPAFSIAGSQPLAYAPARTHLPMYFPLAIVKVAVCIDGPKAVVMVCYSDNYNPKWPTVSTDPPIVGGPYGRHVVKCPSDYFQERCVALDDVAQHSLSDECWQPNLPWTLADLMTTAGLDWLPLLDGVGSHWQLVGDRTCYNY